MEQIMIWIKIFRKEHQAKSVKMLTVICRKIIFLLIYQINIKLAFLTRFLIKQTSITYFATKQCIFPFHSNIG